MTLNLEPRCSAVENGEIYGISDINFTIASFAANGRSQCGVVTPERVAMSKTSQWGLSKTREINFTIASFAANGHEKPYPLRGFASRPPKRGTIKSFRLIMITKN